MRKIEVKRNHAGPVIGRFLLQTPSHIVTDMSFDFLVLLFLNL